MEGCEGVSGNVGRGRPREERDGIASRECVRFGINIFLDA